MVRNSVHRRSLLSRRGADKRRSTGAMTRSTVGEGANAPRRVSRSSATRAKPACPRSACSAGRTTGPRPSCRARTPTTSSCSSTSSEGEHVLRVDGRDRRLVAGDAFVIAPGVGRLADPSDPGRPRGIWAVFFPADAVDPAAPASLVSWRTHPLLSPFVGSPRSGGQHLRVPPADRAAWLAHLTDLDDGAARAARRLRRRRPGPPHAPARAPGPPSAGRTGGAGGRTAARRGARRRSTIVSTSRSRCATSRRPSG